MPDSPAPLVAGDRSAAELLVLRMADELDLPPRRVRGALARLLRRLRTTALSVERLEGELEAWRQRMS